ncbi:unnamed protein product [Moneuplotes crassus]|uniref:Uncharacterized protein n=1 Tax=Euplotes crassus TaxID=5936 RepID=A0AAD2D518_EUPCR|nr:unnamed protein product [Moneuplotes crassus]
MVKTPSFILCLVVLLGVNFVVQVSAMYKQGCFRGYYEDGGCRPCHGSCRSCSGPDRCDTCEDYMFLGDDNIRVEGSQLEGVEGSTCGKCADGEYYDMTGNVCRSCDGKCISACAYQNICFECDNDQVFDLESLICIDFTECVSPKHLLINPQYTLPSICRTLDYFIDPFSSRNIELGTQSFPYRSFTALASEIINIHSNSNVNINIFTSDAYIKDDVLKLINITNVTISQFPDYLSVKDLNLLKSSENRPLLIPTHFIQHGISEKALFHILNSSQTNESSALEGHGFGGYELSAFNGSIGAIKILRTSLQIEGVDFYREELDYNQLNKLLVSIYLQDRLLNITNCGFNITGEIVNNHDPINVYFKNIVVEGYSLKSLYHDVPFICNYPGAFLHGEIFANNITYLIYKDRTSPKNTWFLFSSGPANVTFRNIDLGKLYSSMNDLSIGVGYFVSPVCLPDDEEIHKFSVDYLTASLPFEGDATKIMVNGFIGSQPHYRIYEISFSHFEFSNYRIQRPTGFLSLIGSPIDSIKLSDTVVSNCSTIGNFFSIHIFHQAVISNLTFEDIPENNCIMRWEALANVVAQDINITNYSSSKIRTLSDINVVCNSQTRISVAGLYLRNCSFSTFPFIDVNGKPELFEILDSSYEGIQMDGDTSLIYFTAVSSLVVSNQTFRYFVINAGDESNNFILDINSLDLNNSENIALDTIMLSSTDISLINLKSIVPSSSGANMTFTNLSIKDAYLIQQRPMISTEGFISSSDFHVIFDNLTVSNITFRRIGEIFNFKHYLANPVVIKNSVFEDLSSASFYTEAIIYPDLSLSTRVIVDNCEFKRINNPQRSFIESKANGYFEILSCNFSEISSTNDFSGIASLAGDSQCIFINDIFTNNSAISSTLFKIGETSKLSCENCQIFNNFALSYAIFEVTSDGSITFSNSSLYNNYAIQHSLGIIQETVHISVLSNCKLYNNFYLSYDEITQAVNGKCGRICMISDKLKEFLSINPNKIIETPKSNFALTLITSSIKVTSGTEIYNQPYLLNCFLSEIFISEVKLYSVEFTGIYILILSSNFSIEKSSIYSANVIEEGSLIRSSDSRVIINNITYSNSNAAFILSSSAELEVYGLRFQKIHEAEWLMSIYRSPKLKLEDIQLVDYSTSTGRVIFIDKCEHLIILNTTVANYTKTLFVIRSSYVSLIENLHVSGYYRALEVVNSNIQLINHSSFSQCGSDKLIYAGALYIEESNVTLSNTSFFENKAVSGGAIASICSTHINCNVKIQSSNFILNKAIQKGGSIYYTYNSPLIDYDTVFTDNSAPYGDNIASYPVMIGPVDGKILDNIIIDFVSPGIPIEQEIILALYDGDGQTMVLDNSSQIVITPLSANASIKGISSSILTNGATKFSGFTPISSPGSSQVEYELSTKVIDKDKVKSVINLRVSQPNIIVNFSYCKPGEQVIDNQCIECPAGTYSFEWNSNSCNLCLENAACLGKQELQVAQGFWRSSTNSTDIIECILKEACEGGYYPENDYPVKCAPGYTGKLCSKCQIIDSHKYQKIDDFKCEVCPNPVTNALRIISLVLLMFGFFMMTIITNVRKTTESEFSTLLRILTSYLQIITTSMSMTAKYPSSMANIFMPLNRIGDSSEPFLSFDCFITDYEIKGPFDSNAILKLFLIMLLPIFLCLAVFSVWFVLMIIRKNWVKDIKRCLTVSFISIIFLLHPKLTEAGINAFRCVNLGDNSYATRIDTAIECYSSSHLKWCILIAVPILAIWVVSVPVIGLVILSKAHKSNNTRVLETFLILFQGLKDEIFYWEFVNTFRKVLIVMSFLLPTNYKIGFSIILMVVSERLERRLKPYKSEEHTNISLLSTAAGIITLNASYVYEQEGKVPHLNFVILLMLIIVNSRFLIEWSYLFLKCFKSKYKLVNYVFILTTKLLCKKLPQDDSYQQDQDISQPNKVLYKPRRRGRNKFKRKRRRIRKIKKKQIKNPKFQTSKKKPTDKINYTTQRDLVSNQASRISSNNAEQIAERFQITTKARKIPVRLDSDIVNYSNSQKNFFE